MRQYMVIESFLPGCKDKIYERFHQKGRMLPDGLVYVNSWLEKDGDRCFQLMETDDPSLFQEWLGHWKDLVAMEVVELGEKPKPRGTASKGSTSIDTCLRGRIRQMSLRACPNRRGGDAGGEENR